MSEQSNQDEEGETYIKEGLINLPSDILAGSTSDANMATGTKSIVYKPIMFAGTVPSWNVGESPLVDHLISLAYELSELRNENKEIRKEYNEIKQKLNVLTQQPERIVVFEKPDEEIRELIIQYYKEHEGEEIYPSDVAYAYNLEARKVFEICENLRKRGILIEHLY